MGKVHTVCVRCVPTLHRKCVEYRVFYPTISQRSCHVQHSTCSQNAAGHSIFNIKEFQTAFSTLHCTVSKRILHGKSGYSVHTECSYPTISQRSCMCTALYLLPKCSLALYFRYTRVLSCFFNNILYSKQVHFIRDKWIQCALTLLRMRVKTRVFYTTISKRSCHIQHSQTPVIQRTFCAMHILCNVSATMFRKQVFLT